MSLSLYIYIYMYVSLSIYRHLSLYTHIYIYIYTHTYTHVSASGRHPQAPGQDRAQDLLRERADVRPVDLAGPPLLSNWCCYRS